MQYRGLNMDVKFVNTPNGYTFYFDNKVVGEGEYTEVGFELLDEEDISVYDNAMLAFSSLKHRYTKYTSEKSLSSKTQALLRAIS